MSEIVGQFQPDQKRFLISQIAGGAYNTLVAGALMTGFLLYIGIPAYYTGLLMSIPMLANVIQILTDHLWDCFSHSGRTIIRMVLSARGMILAVVLIPVISKMFSGSTFDTTALKIICAAAIWLPAYILAAGSGIRLNYWMVSIFPSEYISVLLAYRDRIVIGISAVLSFAAGYYIDSLAAAENAFDGYTLVFAIAGIISVLDFWILKDVEYTTETGKKNGRPFFKCIKEVWEEKTFLRFESYIFFLNFAVNIANPYYNAYMIDRLHLKYTTMMLLTILLAAAEIAVAGVWGKLGTENTWWRILKFVTKILGVQFIVWSFVTEKSIGLIVAIYISSGLIATGLSASQFMLPYRYVNRENAMSHMSMHTAVVALGGFTGSAAGSFMIKALENTEFYVLGLPFSSMQINMVISGSMIIITGIYASCMRL